MESKDLIHNFFKILITVGKDITSKSYITMLINSIVKSLQGSYPVLNKISSNDDGFEIDNSINDVPNEEVNDALREFFNVFRDPFDKMADLSLLNLIISSLNKNILDELKNREIIFQD
jgi:hypothetical protein